jgi:hypothetical protein
MTTKRENERRARMFSALEMNGIGSDDALALRRISMTLHRWHEMECGMEQGHIERDEKTGKPLFFNARARYLAANDPRAWSVIPDRETGALRRLEKIMAKYPALSAYVQGDPRGVALYILRPGDVPAGEDADSYYSRGIAVY